MYYDEKLQKWLPGSRPQAAANVMPMGMSLADQTMWQVQDAQRQANAKADQAFDDRVADKKPLFASDPGKEFVNIAGNALFGLATDYVDLGLGAVDALRAGASVATGQKRGDALYFDPTEIFNDSDNPLTRLRRETFKTESQAGEAVSNIVRIGTSLLAVPKVAAKGVALPFQGVAKIAGMGDKVEKIGAVAEKIFNPLAKREGIEDVMKGLNVVSSGMGEAGQKAIKTAVNNEYLLATLDDIGKAAIKSPKDAAGLGMVERWMANTADAVTKSFRVPGKSTIRTIGEALAWDAFVAFNVAGEGDQSMDSTIGDMLTTSGNKWLEALGAPTTTYASDPAIAIKLKQMAEGLVTGAALEYAMGLGRIWRFANDYRRASPEEQAKILNAFKGYAQPIGNDLGKLLPPSPKGGAMVPTPWRNPRAPEPDQLPPGAQGPFQGRSGPETVGSNEPPGAMVQSGVVPAEVQIPEGGGVLTGTPERPALPEGSRGLPGTPERPALPGTGGSSAGITEPQRGVVQGLTDQGRQDIQAFIDSGDKSQYIQAANIQINPTDSRFVYTPAVMKDIAAQVLDNVRLAAGATAEALPPWTAAGLREGIQSIINLVSSQEGGLTPELVRALQEGVVAKLPQRRTELLDLLTSDTTRLNASGMQSAADSIWVDYIKSRSLKEGWGQIDPETFQLKFKRSEAFRQDSDDAIFKQSQALDSIADDANFPVVPVDQPTEILRYQAETGVPIDMEASALIASQEADNLANSEAARQAMLGRTADKSLPQRLGDAEAVQAFLGDSLDNLAPQPTVQRAAQGRGWEVLDPEGQVLSRATTKRQADLDAQKNYELLRKNVIAQARQAEIDDTAKALNVAVGNPIVDSPITAKVKVSEAQARAAAGIDPELDKLLQTVTGKTGTVELSITEMNRLSSVLSDAIKNATGPQKNALNKLSSRLSTAMKLAEPEARAQQTAQWLADQAKTQLTEGIFCDFL